VRDITSSDASATLVFRIFFHGFFGEEILSTGGLPFLSSGKKNK
jgi:hypothetical protein